MKSFVIARVISVGLFLVGSPLLAAETAWQTDFQAAQNAATKEHKYVLLDFTGSDWCPWCVKMDREVFAKSQFSSFAGEKLVLVKLDFPQSKEQSDAERSQNKQLAAKFGVEGFPTYILLDPAGKEVKRQVGYLAGGPSEFIRWTSIQ